LGTVASQARGEFGGVIEWAARRQLTGGKEGDRPVPTLLAGD
jgi:hypothetical protein